jgi:hypothetical protein
MKPNQPIGKDILAVITGSLYLLLYCVLLQFENTLAFAFLMFAFSPFLLLWMVYTVLKRGKYLGPELGNEEYGYQDKEKNDTRTF